MIPLSSKHICALAHIGQNRKIWCKPAKSPSQGFSHLSCGIGLQHATGAAAQTIRTNRIMFGSAQNHPVYQRIMKFRGAQDSIFFLRSDS